MSLQVEILSDDEEEEEEDVIALTEDRYRPQSLDKMIALIAMLVEKSRGDDKQLHISHKDYMAIIGGKVNRQKCLIIFNYWKYIVCLYILIFFTASKLNMEVKFFYAEL